MKSISLADYEKQNKLSNPADIVHKSMSLADYLKQGQEVPQLSQGLSNYSNSNTQVQEAPQQLSQGLANFQNMAQQNVIAPEIFQPDTGLAKALGINQYPQQTPYSTDQNIKQIKTRLGQIDDAMSMIDLPKGFQYIPAIHDGTPLGQMYQNYQKLAKEKYDLLQYVHQDALNSLNSVNGDITGPPAPTSPQQAQGASNGLPAGVAPNPLNYKPLNATNAEMFNLANRKSPQEVKAAQTQKYLEDNAVPVPEQRKGTAIQRETTNVNDYQKKANQRVENNPWIKSVLSEKEIKDSINKGRIGPKEELIHFENQAENIPVVGTPIAIARAINLKQSVDRLKADNYKTKLAVIPYATEANYVSAKEQKEADQAKVNRYMKLMAEKTIRGTSAMADVSSGVAAMPSYMVDFMIGEGLTGNIAKGITKRSAKYLGEAAVKGTKNAFVKGAKKLAVKGVQGVTKSVVEGTLIAMTQPQRAAISYLQKRLPKGMVVNPDKTVEFLGSQKPATALLQAVGGTLTGAITETTGGNIFEPVFGKIAKALRIKYAQKTGKTLTDKAFREMRWDGFLSEFSEEELNNVLDGALGIQNYGNKKDPTYKERLLSTLAYTVNGRQLLVTAGVLAAPMAAKAGLNKVEQGVNTYREAKTEKVKQKVVGKLKDEIKNADPLTTEVLQTAIDAIESGKPAMPEGIQQELDTAAAGKVTLDENKPVETPTKGESQNVKPIKTEVPESKSGTQGVAEPVGTAGVPAEKPGNAENPPLAGEKTQVKSPVEAPVAQKNPLTVEPQPKPKKPITSKDVFEYQDKVPEKIVNSGKPRWEESDAKQVFKQAGDILRETTKPHIDILNIVEGLSRIEDYIDSESAFLLHIVPPNKETEYELNRLRSAYEKQPIVEGNENQKNAKDLIMSLFGKQDKTDWENQYRKFAEAYNKLSKGLLDEDTQYQFKIPEKTKVNQKVSNNLEKMILSQIEETQPEAPVAKENPLTTEPAVKVPEAKNNPLTTEPTKKPSQKTERPPLSFNDIQSARERIKNALFTIKARIEYIKDQIAIHQKRVDEGDDKAKVALQAHKQNLKVYNEKLKAAEAEQRHHLSQYPIKTPIAEKNPINVKPQSKPKINPKIAEKPQKEALNQTETQNNISSDVAKAVKDMGLKIEVEKNYAKNNPDQADGHILYENNKPTKIVISDTADKSTHDAIIMHELIHAALGEKIGGILDPDGKTHNALKKIIKSLTGIHFFTSKKTATKKLANQAPDYVFKNKAELERVGFEVWLQSDEAKKLIKEKIPLLANIYNDVEKSMSGLKRYGNFLKQQIQGTSKSVNQTETQNKEVKPGIEIVGGVKVSESDIDYETARRAHLLSTVHPELVAKKDQKQYVKDIKRIYKNLKESAKSIEQQKALSDWLQQYKNDYVKWKTKFLKALSKTLNPPEPGSNKLPTYNQQAGKELNDIEMKLDEWNSNAINDIEEKLGIKERSTTEMLGGVKPLPSKTKNQVTVLRKVSKSMIDKANEVLNADRLENTPRRARIAAGVTDDAREKLAIAKTISKIADAIESGSAKLLTKIKNASQVRQLDKIVKVASYDQSREENKVKPAITTDTAKYATFPYPEVNKGYISDVKRLKDVKGLKQAVKDVVDWLSRGTDTFVTIYPESQSKTFDALLKIYKHDKEALGWYFKDKLAEYNRLKKAGINNKADLENILKEYIDIREGKQAENPVVKAERALVGKKVGIDYFPTPKEIADKVIDKADISPGQTVLEPSAGKGNLLDAIKRRYGEVKAKAVEISSDLVNVLKAKGYNVEQGDFTNHEGKYDRIVMNPPFSKNQDIKHVRRAYDMLNPGGRLVAIMSEHGFFAEDKTSKEFRGWLDDVGAEVEKLSEGSFKKAEVQTGVNARLVTIDKASEPVAKAEQTATTQPPADVTPKAEVQKTPKANTQPKKVEAPKADMIIEVSKETTKKKKKALITRKVKEAINNLPDNPIEDASAYANKLANLEEERSKTINAINIEKKRIRENSQSIGEELKRDKPNKNLVKEYRAIIDNAKAGLKMWAPELIKDQKKLDQARKDRPSFTIALDDGTASVSIPLSREYAKAQGGDKYIKNLVGVLFDQKVKADKLKSLPTEPTRISAKVAKNKGELVEELVKSLAQKGNTKLPGIKGAKVDNDSITVTNGMVLFQVKRRGEFGYKDGVVTATGKYMKEGEDRFPKDIESFFDSGKDKIAEENIYAIRRKLKQAENTYKEQESIGGEGVLLYANPDGTVGMAVRVPETGTAKIGIQPDATFISAINPKYFSDILKAHELAGSETVKILYDSTKDGSPIVTKGEKGDRGVLMPVKSDIDRGAVYDRNIAGSTSILSDSAEEIYTVAHRLITGMYKAPKALIEVGRAHVMRATDYIERLGESGRELARGLRNVSAKSANWARTNEANQSKILNGLSKKERIIIAKQLSPYRKKNVPKYLQDKANSLLSIILDRDMHKANELDMERTLKDGKKIPVGGKGEAFPMGPNAEGRMVLEEADKMGLTSPRVLKTAQRLVDEDRAETVDEALAMIRAYRDSLMRGKNNYLESFRTPLTEDLIEWDPLKVLPSLLERNAITLMSVEEWGVNLEKAKALIERIGQEFGQDKAKMIDEFFKAEMGASPGPLKAAQKLFNVAGNYQTMTKLGGSFLSAYRNLGQRFSGLSQYPFWRVMLPAIIDYPPLFRALRAKSMKLQEQQFRLGVVGQHTELSATNKVPGELLTRVSMSGFIHVEGGNQGFVGLVAGRGLMNDIRDYFELQNESRMGRIIDGILSLGEQRRSEKLRLINSQMISDLTNDELLDMLSNIKYDEKTGELLMDPDLLADLELGAAHRMVNDTQFAMNMATRRLWWKNHPGLRLLWKFKVFGIDQVAMIYSRVIKAAARGNFMPMLRFMTWTAIMGELYNMLRDWLTGREESLVVGLMSDSNRNLDDIITRIGNDIIDGGGVGMLADLMWGAGDWVAGPAWSSAKNVGRAIQDTINGGAKQIPSRIGPAARDFGRREVSAYKQWQGLYKRTTPEVKKFFRTMTAPNDRLLKQAQERTYKDNSRFFAVRKWRDRMWAYKHSDEDAFVRNADRVISGVGHYDRSERSMSYEGAARMIDADNIKDAAEFFYILTKNAKTYEDRKKLLQGMRVSMSGSRSPLGRIKDSEMGKFLSKFTPKERTEAVQLQRKWMADAEKAMRMAMQKAKWPAQIIWSGKYSVKDRPAGGYK